MAESDHLWPPFNSNTYNSTLCIAKSPCVNFA
jgi:hypothetical protein